MPTTFVTAAQAEKQVTSHQARLSHAHTFGEGRYLLDGLKLTMETSNRLKAGAGVMLIDGSYVTVDEAGQEWTVENGAQAMKRIDLAGYEYSVGEDGMESLAPKVLKGVPHATAPTMPTYAKGSLLDRPAKLFVPIAKVELDGISAKPPTCVLDTLPTIAGLRDSVSQARVLWNGAWFGSSGEATLSEPLSAQKNGMVLAWSAYVDGEAKDWSWVYTYVPRWHAVAGTGTSGIVCSAVASDYAMAKYLYVYDDRIGSNPENEQAVSVGGLTADNGKWVLRYALGV